MKAFLQAAGGRRDTAVSGLRVMASADEEDEAFTPAVAVFTVD